jgi:hypothetical protein
VASSFPWRSIWKVKVPLRVSFFVWTTTLRRTLTMDNLRRKCIIVVGLCSMCKHSGESVNHLFLHCEVAQVLWSMVFSLFVVTWVMPEGVLELLACWHSQQGNISAEVWRIVPLCVMWIIWRERNEKCFEDQERSMEELKSCLFKLCSIGPTLFVPQFSSCLNFYLFVPLSPFSGAFLCILLVY